MNSITFDNRMRVELIKCNASDIDVARAAWVSNFGEDARERDTARIEGLINYLYRERHMSPFEHGSFTFFCDVPIFVAREFMRHRTFSYNEISARYTTLNPKFYVPNMERPLVQHGKVGEYSFTPGTEEQYAYLQRWSENTHTYAWNTYVDLVERGIAREVSRDVLPVGIYTQFYATVNPRNLMQFLELRTAGNALAEIRDTAEQMEDFLEEKMPLTHKAYTQKRERDSIVRELTSEFDTDTLRRALEYAKSAQNEALSAKYKGAGIGTSI